MKGLENLIKTVARESGAALTGISSVDRLANAPLSAAPGYLLSGAKSIISFAVPYDRKVLRKFFSKEDWLSYNHDKKESFRRLYATGDRVKNLLESRGFKALSVELNCIYRPEKDARDATELIDMIPDFSHRYGAVAAGIGRLGWSGNLMTPQYGSAIQLGTVLTTAVLESDPVLEKNPCDRCRMCVVSCPMGMIDKRESVDVILFGMTESIAQKRTNNCCFIGCSGYHGLSPDGNWTSWSPYRLPKPLPGEDPAIDDLCTRIRKQDPYVDPDGLNSYSDFRKFNLAPDYVPTTTCSHCSNICWENRADRVENRKILAESGIVVLRMDGSRAAVDKGSDLVEIDTPFVSKVALLRHEYEAALTGSIRVNPDGARHRWDRKVLTALKASCFGNSQITAGR